MEKKTPLTELRDLLSELVRDSGDEGLSSREIAVAFRTKHSKVVKQSSEELELIALVKMVGEVSKRRSKPTLVPEQGDLFLEYAVPPVVPVPAAGEGEKGMVWKSFLKLTLAEVNLWLAEHSRAKEANLKRNSEIKKLLKAIKPFMRDNTTVEEAWAAKRAAEKKEAESSLV
jgi:hypothetical protein